MTKVKALKGQIPYYICAAAHAKGNGGAATGTRDEGDGTATKETKTRENWKKEKKKKRKRKREGASQKGNALPYSSVWKKRRSDGRCVKASE